MNSLDLIFNYSHMSCSKAVTLHSSLKALKVPSFESKAQMLNKISVRYISTSASHTDRDSCGKLSSESNRVTRSRMAKVCCLCSAPPEKSMQLQGWGQRSPLWDLSGVQSISLSLSLSLLASTSFLTCVSAGVHQRLQNLPSLNCYNLALLKFLLHL